MRGVPADLAAQGDLTTLWHGSPRGVNLDREQGLVWSTCRKRKKGSGAPTQRER